MIRGIGTSKGIGIGHALIIDEPQIEAKTCLLYTSPSPRDA